MPKLQIILPDGGNATHDLNEDTITVGRLPDNTIQIDDVSVSSHHAQLTREDGHYILEDLGSTNGTTLNGQRHRQGKLMDGDQVCFGKIDAVFVSENPEDARAMPEDDGIELQPAENSVRPANFANASPFQSKKKKKDPAAKAVMALAVVAILVFAFAVVSVFGLKSPL